MRILNLYQSGINGIIKKLSNSLCSVCSRRAIVPGWFDRLKEVLASEPGRTHPPWTSLSECRSHRPWGKLRGQRPWPSRNNRQIKYGEYETTQSSPQSLLRRGRSKGGHGAMPPNHQRFFLKYVFNEFSDIFGFDYWFKQWNNHIHHAMYIVFIHSQSELSAMYILAAL